MRLTPVRERIDEVVERNDIPSGRGDSQLDPAVEVIGLQPIYGTHQLYDARLCHVAGERNDDMRLLVFYVDHRGILLQ